MTIEYVKKAWDIYKKNATSFIVAKLVAGVIVAIIALIGVGMIFSSAGMIKLFKMSMYSEEATPEYFQEIMTEPFFPASMFLNLGAAFIFFVLAAVAMIFFKVGIYGMAAEAIRGKTRVETMFKVGKQRGLTALVASILIGIAMFVVAMIMGGLTAILPIAGAVIGIVIFFITAILFCLVFPIIAMENKIGALNAVERSVRIAKKNFFELCGLLFIYVVISAIIWWIPVIGILTLLLVITPMLTISLVLFYKKKK